MCPFLAFEGERTLMPLFCSRAFPAARGCAAVGRCFLYPSMRSPPALLWSLGRGWPGLQLLVLRFVQAPAIPWPHPKASLSPVPCLSCSASSAAQPPGRCSVLPVFNSMFDVCAGSMDLMSVCPCQGSFDCECDSTDSLHREHPSAGVCLQSRWWKEFLLDPFGTQSY